MPYSRSYSAEIVVVRQLAGLARADEAGAEAVGDGGAEDEPARLRPQHDVDVLAGAVLDDAVDRLAQRTRVLQERHDVAEEDALLGEVRDVAHVGGEVDAGVGHGISLWVRLRRRVPTRRTPSGSRRR